MRTSALSLLNLLFKCFAFSTRLNRSQCIFVRTGLRLHPFPSLIYYSTPSIDPLQHARGMYNNVSAAVTDETVSIKHFFIPVFVFIPFKPSLFVFSRFSKIFFSDPARFSVFSSGQCCTQISSNTFYLYSFTFFTH